MNSTQPSLCVCEKDQTKHNTQTYKLATVAVYVASWWMHFFMNLRKGK